MDAPSGEVILNIESSADGRTLVRFNLYDSAGHPTAQTDAVSFYPEGLTVRAIDGELLLELPTEPGASICYRLYNRRGDLLTVSDGVSTRIEPCLRMESSPRPGSSRVTTTTHDPPNKP